MNTKIILAVVLAIVVIAAWAVNAHRNKGFKTVSSEEFAQIIGDTATVQLLDVRTKEEYEEGHIADALLVDFYSYNFEEQATAKPLSDLVNTIRNSPKDFPEWHTSSTAELYNPPIFENKKESKGFWF